MDKKARLESLRKRKRLAELRAKRDASSEVAEPVAEPVPAPQAPEFTPSGSGFLGATLTNSVPLGEHLMSAGKGLEAVGQNLPIVGPMVEKAAMAANDMTPEQYEAYKAQSSEEFPIATKAGEVAGSVGPYSAIPGSGLGALGASLGVSGLDQAVQGKSGAEIGQNLAMEGALGGLGMGVGSLLKRINPEKLRQMAGLRAEAAAGLDSSKALRDKLTKAIDEGKIKKGELGNRLLDQGVMQATDTAADVAEKSKALADAAQGEIDQILKPHAAQTQSVQDNLLEQLDTPALTALKERINKKINTQVDLLEEAGETLDLKTLNSLKDEIANEFSSTAKSAGSKANEKLKAGLTKSIEKSLGERELNRLRELNKQLEVANMARDTAGEVANKGMSGLKKMGIITSVATGNPRVAATLAASHVFEKHKDAMLAVGIRKASGIGKYAAQFADAAEAGGKTAVGALHFKLMQEDPEYRKQHSKKED